MESETRPQLEMVIGIDMKPTERKFPINFGLTLHHSFGDFTIRAVMPPEKDRPPILAFRQDLGIKTLGRKLFHGQSLENGMI